MNAYSTYSESLLVSLLRQNDEAALREIFHRYANMLQTYSSGITRNIEDAADIVQEVLTDIWNRRNALDTEINLAAYLHKSVRNQSLKYIQRSKKESEFFRSLVNYASTSAMVYNNNLELNELTAEMSKAVETLPAKMREVFTLSREEQCSHKEIANRLNITESTAKKQVQNALKIIRQQIAPLTSSIIVIFIRDVTLFIEVGVTCLRS